MKWTPSGEHLMKSCLCRLPLLSSLCSPRSDIHLSFPANNAHKSSIFLIFFFFFAVSFPSKAHTMYKNCKECKYLLKASNQQSKHFSHRVVSLTSALNAHWFSCSRYTVSVYSHHQAVFISLLQTVVFDSAAKTV